MSSRVSSVTAASTAAISSGSGGSGMYSLAPAWIASTAARALFSTPQATSDTWMCSSSSLATRSRMSIATSTISRSEPLLRSTASAWSMDSAWVTAAPRSIAILVAVVSWPLSVPTIRSRMATPFSLISVGLDDFRHRHAELVFHEHHLAAGDQAVVDVNVDGFADLAIELQHGAGAELEQLADVHAGAAENRRHLHRHVEHGFEIGGTAGQVFEILGDRGRIGIGWRRRSAVEIGERDLVVHEMPPSSGFTACGRAPR